MKETKSRKFNSFRNSIFGMVSQIIQLLLSFACRTILIKKLGSEILGINGLYTNILSVLSLAELGLGNTLLFNLYKPLAEKDEDKVASLIKFYGKLYNIIALIIFSIGILIMPILKFMISNDINISNEDLYIYYIIFLANSGLSYLLCYKQTLITADQKNYLIKISNLVFNVISFVSQILILILIPNYKLYLIVTCVFTVIQNITLGIVVDKRYPYIKKKEISPLNTETKASIKKNIFSTFLYKIGVVILTSTDNILISTLVSTLAVGYYSNYNMIITAINGFVSILIYSIYSSIGNLSAENNSEKSHKVFNFMLLFFQYIAIFSSLCFVTVFNDFISIWLGSEYLFNFNVVVVISLTYYFSVAISPVWIYRENFGLFNDVKYLMLISALLNIAFSILLGIYFGVFGILLATLIAKLLTIYIIEPFILFKKIFNSKPYKYFIKQLISLLIVLGLTLLLLWLYKGIEISLLGVFLKIFINFCIVTLGFVLCFHKTEEFQYGYNAFKELLTRKKQKKVV